MSTLDVISTSAKETKAGYVVLINPFEVPSDKAEQVEKAWLILAEYLAKCPGYIDTQLHRALPNPHKEADFRFINIAYWQSPQLFQQAVGSAEFRKLGSEHMPEGIKNHPALFEALPHCRIPANNTA